MIAFDLCAIQDSILFTVGKSKIVWESAIYKDRCDKVEISRIVEGGKGGKSFLLGANYKTRYISPDTKVFLQSQKQKP